mmetsp:Transcript_8801/g.19377  ORF Transcript_8801/g.19377 Transcript_8801/m.19377 type:complete len:448 (-) Transcript_8801:1151-2494(-)
MSLPTDHQSQILSSSDSENEDGQVENDSESRRTLGVLPLALLTFYTVSGGPYAIEPAVEAAGPLLAIASFIIVPFFWSIPEALITAELSSAYPEASGCVAWVGEAFGEKIGLADGYLSWILGVVDNAIYVVILLEYLLVAAGVEHFPSYYRATYLIIVNAVLSYINYRGLEVVGKIALVVAIMSLSPFLLMFLIGIFKINTERLLKSADGMTCLASDGCSTNSGWLDNVKWAPLLNVVFWNVNYFDTVSPFSGNVINPGHTWPRAMFIAVLLVILCCTLTLIVAVGATDSDRLDWKEGYFTTAASIIGGEWLGVWIAFAVAISNLAMYEVEMSQNSFLLMGMAERGYIPKNFSHRSSYDTPTYSLIVCTVVTTVASFFSFIEMLEVVNLFYCLSLLLEFTAFIRLRISSPNGMYLYFSKFIVLISIVLVQQFHWVPFFQLRDRIASR